MVATIRETKAVRYHRVTRPDRNRLHQSWEKTTNIRQEFLFVVPKQMCVCIYSLFVCASACLFGEFGVHINSDNLKHFADSLKIPLTFKSFVRKCPVPIFVFLV